MTALFAEVSKTLSGVLASAADGGPAAFLAQMLQPERLRRMAEGYLLRSLLADYVVLLAFSWWAGQAAAQRRARPHGCPDGFRFSRFRLESGWLWP